MHKHGAQREQVLPLLDTVNQLDVDSVRSISEQTGVREADIWGTATFYSLLENPAPKTRVCDGLSCQLKGADALASQLEQQGKTCERVSCLAQCDRAPAALDEEMNLETFEKGERGFMPDNPELPINLGGNIERKYSALAKTKKSGSGFVVSELKAAGLQGRGGAGFPAYLKWIAVQNEQESERYVVCNADESEPGTFKDREIILRQCHKMLEGLAVAATAVEAQEIIIYIRGEFTNERRVLKNSIEEAKEQLSDFNIRIATGHGNYICGEETALLESLEGKRGMPRLRPPYPTQNGFRGKPTLIHNVETISCVPAIIERGGQWFRDLGRTEPGTKLYSISGHVNRPGVYELPMGVSLEELVETAGGYEGTPFCFSPGGASSGFLPMKYGNLPLDSKSLAGVDSMLGSGGVVVLNETVDIRDAVMCQLKFFERESCGQCAPCRIGTQYLRQKFESFIHKLDTNWFDTVDDVCWEMEEASICGLGMTAFKPLQTAFKYFPEHFKQPKK